MCLRTCEHLQYDSETDSWACSPLAGEAPTQMIKANLPVNENKQYFQKPVRVCRAFGLFGFAWQGKIENRCNSAVEVSVTHNTPLYES